MADELFVDQDEVEGTASGVWSRMLAGNRRFAEGKPEHPNRGAEAREALVDTHAPEAAILSCSDARVSPDIIFDSGLGDLFTVRTAGQIIDEAVIASLEYAVTVLGVRLLVVLGHQNCGAIKQVSKDYEALLHELTADAEDSLMAADSISDIDERICDSDSIMMRTVGFFDLAGARIGTGIGGGFRARAHRTHHRTAGGTFRSDPARAGRGSADDHRSTLPARHRQGGSAELLTIFRKKTASGSVASRCFDMPLL